MPQLVFDVRESDLVLEDDRVALSRSGLHLRRAGADPERWEREGRYFSGTALFANRRPRALSELFAFRVDGSFPADSSAEYQLSLDGGTTFLYWDGGAWAVAGPTDFSTERDVDANIAALTASLPFPSWQDLTGPQIQIRARLNPSTAQRSSPVLHALFVYCEWPHQYQDNIKRSLFEFYQDNFRADVLHRAPSVAAQTSVLIREKVLGKGSILGSPAVYDLAGDPARTTDLFASLVHTPGGDATITLAAPIPAPGIVEVRFQFRPRLYTTQVDEDSQDADIPSILAEFPSEVDETFNRTNNDEAEISISQSIARVRPEADKMRTTIQLIVQAENESMAQPLLDALGDIFQYFKGFPSVATAEILPVVSYTPITQADQRVSGMHTKNVLMDVTGRRWKKQFDVVPLTTEILARYGSPTVLFEEGPVTAADLPVDNREDV